MPLTNWCQPTKAGSSVASPGCRRFRSRDDTSTIVTPRVALRSRSHERCEGAVTSDRDVCLDRHLEPDARGQRLRSRRRVTPEGRPWVAINEMLKRRSVAEWLRRGSVAGCEMRVGSVPRSSERSARYLGGDGVEYARESKFMFWAAPLVSAQLVSSWLPNFLPIFSSLR
jgi:hypothetical protein